MSADFNGEATILWFSFTGGVLEAGEGEIMEVTYQVNDDVDGGPCEISLNTTEAGTALSDSAGNAFFYSSDSVHVNIAKAIEFSFVQTSDDKFAVVMNNTTDVSAYQFEINDTPDYLSLSSSQSYMANDFTVSAIECNGNTECNVGEMQVLVFSFTGAIITPSSAALLEITVDLNDNAPSEGETELCFDALVVSDPFSENIVSGTSCATFTYPCVDCPSQDDLTGCT
jgi:hypothetical protein